MTELTKLEIAYPPYHNVFSLVCDIEQKLDLLTSKGLFLDVMDFRRDLYGAINRIEATRFREDVKVCDVIAISSIAEAAQAMIDQKNDRTVTISADDQRDVYRFVTVAPNGRRYIRISSIFNEASVLRVKQVFETFGCHFVQGDTDKSWGFDAEADDTMIISVEHLLTRSKTMT